jgi:hypothetical protein
MHLLLTSLIIATSVGFDDIRVHLQMTHLPRRDYFKFSNTCVTLFEMAKVSS